MNSYYLLSIVTNSNSTVMVSNPTGRKLKQGFDLLHSFQPFSIRESNRVVLTVSLETDKGNKNGKIAALHLMWMPRDTERR